MSEVAHLPVADHRVTEQQVQDLADTFGRVVHTVERARNKMLTTAQHDGEWSNQLIISMIVWQGPMRSGALAEALHWDPSTISRQVAGLVKDGLVERRADPEDGRASLLAVTEAGRAAHSRHVARRNEHYRAFLGDWDADEYQQLTGLLARFLNDFETYQHHLADGSHRRASGEEQS